MIIALKSETYKQPYKISNACDLWFPLGRRNIVSIQKLQSDRLGAVELLASQTTACSNY